MPTNITAIIVFTLEGFCHMFDMENFKPIDEGNFDQQEILPYSTQQVIMNISTGLIGDFNHDSRTELIISNSYGILAYYRYVEENNK